MTEFSDYLKAVRFKTGIKNDRQLALRLGLSMAAIYNITRANTIPSDEICLRIAALAGDDPEKVLLLAQKSRAPEAAKKHWESIMRKVAASCAFFLVLSSAQVNSQLFDIIYQKGRRRLLTH